VLEPSSGFSAREVFELFSAEGEEWRHKVGVAGCRDGSAKASTRLLAVSGRVLKTNLARGEGSWESAERQLRSERERGLRALVWHESKLWALFRVGDVVYPLTVCPELRTLRSVEHVAERFDGWIEMLRLACEVARRTGMGLDLNPANFGRLPTGRRLYYLDEELYASLTTEQLAGALAARIPEESGLALDRWRDFGVIVQALVSSMLPQLSSGLADQVLEYPLTQPFWGERTALVEGLRTAASRRPSSAFCATKLLCVLADVHGNLPALDAVLQRARELGAGGYIFLGDAVGYGPHPRECIARLAELPNLVSVKGNHDHCIGTRCLDWGMNGLARLCAKWTLAELAEQDLAWLRELPTDFDGGSWLALHGAPRDPRRFLAYVYELTYEDNLRWLGEHHWKLCLHGHSHVQSTYVEFASGPRRWDSGAPAELAAVKRALLNPGSVGQPRDGDPRAAFALFDPRRELWTPLRTAYPIELTLKDIERKGLPAKAAERLRAGV